MKNLLAGLLGIVFFLSPLFIAGAPAYAGTSPERVSDHKAEQLFKQDTGRTTLHSWSRCDRKDTWKWFRCRTSIRDCECFYAAAVYDFRVRGRSVRVMRKSYARKAHASHRGTAAAAKARIINSNMDGRCGKGFWNRCLKDTRGAYFIRYPDAHSRLYRGYWRETRPGILTRYTYACTAYFLSGPHGLGSFWQSCKRV
jgi:hypothetical protein